MTIPCLGQRTTPPCVAVLAAATGRGCDPYDVERTLADLAVAEAAHSAGLIPIVLTINGRVRQLTVAPWTTLLDLLREDLDLTGTKKGCDHGQCGACTVLVDGQRKNCCLLLAVMQDGAAITTVEGLAGIDGTLHPVQDAFIEYDAFQCGYCTPGQLCSAVGLLAEGHAHSRAEIQEAMSGNICRCGAYPNIVAAIEHVLTHAEAAE